MIKALIQHSPYCTEIRFPCTFDEFYNTHSSDAYELAAELWNLDLAEEGYVFNEETQSYDYRPDEPDESPKME